MVAIARAEARRLAVDDLVDEYQATADLRAMQASVGATPDADTEAILARTVAGGRGRTRGVGSRA